jgi:hypothetical protein
MYSTNRVLPQPVGRFKQADLIINGQVKRLVGDSVFFDCAFSHKRRKS